VKASGPLTPSDATARFVCDRFGLPEAQFTAIPVARGLCGRVWRLNSDGVRYALKELFWDHHQDEREIRRRAAFEAAARSAGVECPESLPTLTGDYLCRLPPEFGDVYVRLYSWIDGVALPSGEGATAWLGDTLSRLHRIRHAAASAPDPRFEAVPTSAQWQELVRALRAAGVAWADDLERLLPRIDDLGAIVAPADPDALIMCHLDFTPANVMRTDTGLVLVDWDNAGPGTAEHDLASTLMAWHAAAPAGITATMAAYARADGPATLTGLSSYSAYLGAMINNLYTQVSTVIEADILDEHRTTARASALRAMAGLPTRSALNQLGDRARAASTQSVQTSV
jgi:phosphotransferase family enzyme